MFYGRQNTFPVQAKRPERVMNAGKWFRGKAHRLQLGKLGFLLLHKDGTEAQIEEIHDINQVLELWTGGIRSTFSFDGELVSVQTYCHQKQDLVAVKVESTLLSEGRLKVRLRFPYPTNQFG